MIKNVCRTEMPKIYNNVHEGKEMIKKAIGGKKILVVLDHVTEVKQLHAMFECPEWFSPGSKIRNNHKATTFAKCEQRKHNKVLCPCAIS